MAPKDIQKEMLPIYAEQCLSRQAVHNLVQKFSEWRTSIEEEERGGRPEEVATPATLQRVEDIIRAESNHKNFTPQVSRDLWNGGTSV